MKKLAAPLLILFFIVLNLLSCDGLDENYSSNPNHRLSFSVDTLSFDTVFTTIGSATKEFMIYNRNDQPLLISEIMLASGEETGFRINVDGRKGDHFQNVRIQADDSLYVLWKSPSIRTHPTNHCWWTIPSFSPQTASNSLSASKHTGKM